MCGNRLKLHALKGIVLLAIDFPRKHYTILFYLIFTHAQTYFTRTAILFSGYDRIGRLLDFLLKKNFWFIH